MNDITVTLTYSEEEAREVARAFLYFTSNVSATREDQDRMSLIRSAIKREIPPPRPDEPKGLGAVVEDGESVLWTHIGNGRWVNDQERHRSFSNVTAVRILSEGVQP